MSNSTSVRPETFSKGAGGWDDKVVLITSAKAERRALGKADNPYRNDAGEIQYINALFVKGIAEGQEKELTREYEVRNLRATEDGEGFVDARTGQPGTISEKSALGRFFTAFGKAGGNFDTIETKTANGVETRFSGLVGAKILFTAEPVLGKDKQQKIDKNGYPEWIFFPKQVLQQGRGATAPKQNGADLDAIKNIVRGIVESHPDKKATRAQLIQSVTKQNPSALQYVLRDSFLREIPGVNYDGATLSA